MKDEILELKGDVHVWVASSSHIEGQDLASQYREILTHEELIREQRFHFERDRRTYLVTRALVRIVLSRYRPVVPRSWRFERDEHGRPCIEANAQGGDLSFNLSHSEGLVILAIAANAQLGVDVEGTTLDSPVLELAEGLFAQREVSQIRALADDEQEARFFALWTLKEAYVKACGKGLSMPLHRFDFDLACDGAVRFDVDPVLGDSAAQWQFWQFQLAPRHVAAVCARRFSGVRRQLVCRSIVPLVSEEAFEPAILRTSQLCS